MHTEAYALMKAFVEKYLDPNQELAVVDIGALNINGSDKDFFDKNPKWHYEGLDIQPGLNVDHVVPPFDYSAIGYGRFDVAVSNQTFEHCTKPWLLILEVEKLLKPSGLVCIVTPYDMGIHPYGPKGQEKDCWRVMPDGMKVLLTEVANFELLEIIVDRLDTVGIGRKR